MIARRGGDSREYDSAVNFARLAVAARSTRCLSRLDDAARAAGISYSRNNLWHGQYVTREKSGLPRRNRAAAGWEAAGRESAAEFPRMKPFVIGEMKNSKRDSCRSFGDSYPSRIRARNAPTMPRVDVGAAEKSSRKNSVIAPPSERRRISAARARWPRRNFVPRGKSRSVCGVQSPCPCFTLSSDKNRPSFSEPDALRRWFM